MRAYSMDLRERIFRDSDAGMTAVAVAEKYDVSRAWIDRLKQRRRETGEVAPRAQRYGPHPKLGPHLHRLADLIKEQPDRTLMFVNTKREGFLLAILRRQDRQCLRCRVRPAT